MYFVTTFMPSIILIEPKLQHLEVLYPQILFLLESDYSVTVATCEKARNVDILKSLKKKVTFIVRKKNEPLFLFLFRISRKKYDLTIFNTLEGSTVQYSYLLFFRKLQVVRVVHNLPPDQPKYLLSSKIQSRVEKSVNGSVFLNKQLADLSKISPDSNSGCFYPVFFDDFLKSRNIKPENSGCTSVLKLGVQGNVEELRRNYTGLIKSVSRLPEKQKQKIQVHIIGNSSNQFGSFLKDNVEKNGLSEIFHFYDEYLSFENFFRILSNMHFLLPLIDKTLPIFSRYEGKKITSTTSMALAVKKPLLVSSDLPVEKNITPIALFYPGPNLETGIMDALRLTDTEYAKLVSNIDNLDEISFRCQHDSYMKIIKKAIIRNK